MGFTTEQRIMSIRRMLSERRGGDPLDDLPFLLSQYDAKALALRLAHEYVQILEQELDELKVSTRFLVEPNDGDNGPSVD